MQTGYKQQPMMEFRDKAPAGSFFAYGGIAFLLKDSIAQRAQERISDLNRARVDVF